MYASITYGNFLSAIIVACNQKKVDKSDYVITLDLTGFKDSTQFKLSNDEYECIDSALCINGKLKFSGNVAEPFSAYITAEDGAYCCPWHDVYQIRYTASLRIAGKMHGKKMSTRYRVRAIPTAFLINPEGIIIAKYVGGGALEKN